MIEVPAKRGKKHAKCKSRAGVDESKGLGKRRDKKKKTEREKAFGKVVGAVLEGSIINNHFMQGCSRLLVLREHPGHRAKRSHYKYWREVGRCAPAGEGTIVGSVRLNSFQ
jgi:hypothetical protein